MKKKTKWISGALVLLSVLAALSRKKGKKRKESLYRLTFDLRNKDTGTQILSAPKASGQIAELFCRAGCPFLEASGIAEEGSTHVTLVFFLIMLKEEQVAALTEQIKQELNLADATYEKTEQSSREL